MLGETFAFLEFGLPLDPLAEPGGDRRVVVGGPPERGERQSPPRLLGNLSPALQGGEYLFVELRRGDDGYGPEVLGRGTQHRRTSDVYLLDGLLLRGVSGDGLLEGVEVDADQVYRADVLLDELLYVVGVFEIGEDAAVHFGVQRLDPAAEYLRRARHLGDGDDLYPGLRERSGGAAGGDDLEPHPREPPREVLDPPLVRDRDQRPSLHTSILPRK